MADHDPRLNHAPAHQIALYRIGRLPGGADARTAIPLKGAFEGGLHVLKALLRELVGEVVVSPPVDRREADSQRLGEAAKGWQDPKELREEEWGAAPKPKAPKHNREGAKGRCPRASKGRVMKSPGA
jgi:hypothetical protein